MLEFRKSNEEALVEAIEEGKIVKVSEDYARREGLLILRRPIQIVDKNQASLDIKKKELKDRETFLGFDSFRKPLKTENNEFLNSLVENFQWKLAEKRKLKKLTRKQVAAEIGETELTLKMAENGIIPDKNYVLVSKLENFYGLKLRKEGAGASMRSLVEKKAADASKGHRTFGLAKKEEVVKRENPANKRVDEAKDESMSGNDIELIFDE